MVRDPYAQAEPPDSGEVLAILADEDARTIIQLLDEPMTAKELLDRCDIPESTLYRKLDRMTSTKLLEQRTRIRRDGRHTNEYVPAFDEITVSQGGDGELQVSVTPASKPADARLAELWGEVTRGV